MPDFSRWLAELTRNHLAVQTRVARAMDLSHPAGPNQADEVVRAEASAGAQGHALEG